MTTDTFPKVATRRASIGGVEVTINGIAKGAGMIAPDMATMLCLRRHRRADRRAGAAGAPEEGRRRTLQLRHRRRRHLDLRHAAVFRDRSRGAPRRAERLAPSDRRLPPFRRRSRSSCAISRSRSRADGEGARKFVDRRGRWARARDASAKRIAMSIANSPLVKTAVAGEDANWGRVVMAVGKAGEPAERDKLAIWFGDIRVAVKGGRDPGYDEARDRRLHARPGNPHPRRSRPRPRRGDGVDLRPDEGLCRDQWGLPELRTHGTTVTATRTVETILAPVRFSSSRW